MKVTAERVPESKVLLRIEIPPEQVEQAIEKTFLELSRRVKVPGFRPGKAPRNLIVRYLGGPESVQR
ncbi:MAG TPA: trigger factor family protein, partial [Chloroflexota bacterium]|nr:trigger factor family protein [Chloroflexota bacterium]